MAVDTHNEEAVICLCPPVHPSQPAQDLKQRTDGNKLETLAAALSFLL